jgi:hypothetical protein
LWWKMLGSAARRLDPPFSAKRFSSRNMAASPEAKAG